MQKVRANIHLANIRRNAEAFSALTKTKICAVVKANAYGHGAEEVVSALSQTVDSFAVSILDEAIAIRVAACGKEILVLTPPTEEEEGYLLAANGFTATVDSLKAAALLSKVCKQYRLSLNVHLKVNTGMNRYGMNVQTLGKVCKLLRFDPYLRVKGIYSHLCECDLTRAEKQRMLFERMRKVCKRYFPAVISHLGGTYGALLGKKYTYDAVRIGLGLYGYLPCGATAKTGVAAATVARLDLQKGMTVYAKAISVRKYVFGGAGYGKELTGKKPEYLSVYRLGYADGFLRKRKNGVVGWEKNANVLCMDACVRAGKCRRGQWLPVMTDADQTADLTGTVSYEVLCAATRRAEFVYDDEIAFCGGDNSFKKGTKGAPACIYERKKGGKHQP